MTNQPGSSLEEELAALEATRFPESSTNADLAELHADLALYDSEVMGLVHQIRQGVRVSPQDLAENPALRRRIVERTEIAGIASEYLDYLDHLERVVRIARELASAAIRTPKGLSKIGPPRFAMASSHNNATVTIYVRLLDEGTTTSRPTEALVVGDGLYKLLPTPNYDPEDEHWEFPPGSVVRAKREEFQGEDYLLAVKLS